MIESKSENTDSAPAVNASHTPGPLAWQKMGSRWCLTGQYGMRPIILSANPKGELMLRDAAKDRLIPFDPSHPDARLLASAPCLLEALKWCREEFLTQCAYSDLSDTVLKIEAAIARAEGKEAV